MFVCFGWDIVKVYLIIDDWLYVFFGCIFRKFKFVEYVVGVGYCNGGYVCIGYSFG